jgi:hypothetical protein
MGQQMAIASAGTSGDLPRLEAPDETGQHFGVERAK